MIRSGILGLFLGVAASAAPLFFSVNNNNTDNNVLVTVDLGTGSIREIGGLGLTNVDIEGLARNPTNSLLYGVDDNLDRLIQINTGTGAGTVVNTFGFDVNDVGLAFGPGGTLYFANTRTDDALPELYTVNPTDGSSTLVGALSQKLSGIAFYGGVLYGLGNTQLVTVDPSTAAVSVIGDLGRPVLDGALGFDSAGNGFGVRDLAPDNSGSTEIFQINRITGAASGSIVVGTANSPTPVTLEALAEVPEPGTIAFVAAGLAGLVVARRRKS